MTKISIRTLIGAAALLVISMPVSVLAATKESAVKAGFLYNFTKFIVWPADSMVDKDFNICVFGKHQLGGSLEALYGKPVADKKIVLKHDPDIEESKQCHMAFLAKDDHIQTETFLKRFSGLPVLTVSDQAGFIEQGGMIGLIRVGNRVGFEVSLAPANDANLHLSAQLLKLAKRVKGLK